MTKGKEKEGKERDGDKEKSQAKMATWAEITKSANTAKDIFGTSEFTKLSLEEKMSLMMGGMLKLYEVFATNKKSMDFVLNDEKVGIRTNCHCKPTG